MTTPNKTLMAKTLMASALCLSALAAPAGAANAAEPASCRAVTLAEVGWTDIQATTGVATMILKALGYETKVPITSVPVTFVGLGNNDIDAFLGLWMPSMAGMVKDRLENGSIEKIRANLEGAKYTLVVPKYAHDASVTDLADLDAHKAQFGGKIYGIEPGNDGNQLIQQMIDADAFGLGDWDLVESSEAGMLLQAKGAFDAKQWVVFLGWAPHPMNTKMQIEYLSGGADYFGPDKGGATVHTLTRRGYGDECPNVGRFLKQLAFTVESENIIMGGILDHKLDAETAAKTFLKANPDLLAPWLDGVTTVDGQPGLPAARRAIGLE